MAVTFDYVGGINGIPFQDASGQWWVNVTAPIPYATDGAMQSQNIKCASTTGGAPSHDDIVAAVAAYNAGGGQ